jgi:hypothetical protein
MILLIRKTGVLKEYKRIFLGLTMIAMLSSCQFFEKREIDKRNLTDLVIIGVDKKFDFSDSIPDVDISGKWIQHSVWYKTDSSWKGAKSLNISQYYIFRENGVFHNYETYNDTLVNSYIRGDYLLLPDNSTLTLLVNDNGDTLFQHGDTCKARDIFLYTLNDSVLRIEECVIGDCSDEQFIEFHRAKKE